MAHRAETQRTAAPGHLEMQIDHVPWKYAISHLYLQLRLRCVARPVQPSNALLRHRQQATGCLQAR